MSDLITHAINGNLEKFAEEMKNTLNEKRDVAIKSIEKNLKDQIFAEDDGETTSPEFAVIGEDIDEDCSCVWVETDETDEELAEARRVVKINSKGKRRVKKLCGKGMKLVNGKCVKIKGAEKVTQRKSQKKRKKTLKANSSIIRKRTRLTNKAMKKRKARGI